MCDMGSPNSAHVLAKEPQDALKGGGDVAGLLQLVPSVHADLLPIEPEPTRLKLAQHAQRQVGAVQRPAATSIRDVLRDAHGVALEVDVAVGEDKAATQEHALLECPRARLPLQVIDD